MLFNSLHFLIFLPLVTGLYYLLPFRFRWILIFIASCYFYMAFVPAYILILFFIIGVDYGAALLIEKAKGRRRLLFLVLSLVANIGLLAFFKYYHFISDNLQWALGLIGKGHHHLPNLDVVLPIGLSFHTFQSMSYTIEVYRGKQKAERHLGYFANYVLFFPQMVAGPIERYDSLGKELHKEAKPLYDNFVNGFRLLLFGLFVKTAVADNLAPVVNAVYEHPQSYNSLDVLAAVVLFSFQIYADFYGYSTMALGAARLLGIRIMDNFRTPYLARSVNEFWQRWHISLSSWFRDYLYIPLGGNRVNWPRWALNILIVFMISGLWHGPSWTFVVWGGLHGLAIVMERIFAKLFRFNPKEGWSLLNVLLTIKTFFVVSFIWIFFRAENFEKAKAIIYSLLYNQQVHELKPGYGYALLFAGLLCVFDGFMYKYRVDGWLQRLPVYFRWSLYGVLIFCLMALGGLQKYPFIYFQF